MNYFDTEAESVAISKPDLDRLKRGFILHDPEKIPIGGITVHVEVKSASERRYTVRCFHIDSDESTPGDLQREHELGFLTQGGFGAIRPHEHAGCGIYLELDMTQKA